MTSRYMWVTVVILALAAGGVAGYAGFILQGLPMARALEQRVRERVEAVTVAQLPAIERQQTSSSRLPKEVQEQRRPTALLIIRSGDKEEFLPNSHQLGLAIIITTDGWFVFPSQVLAQVELSRLAVVWDGRTYPLKTIVRDRTTSLVFARAVINNLPTADVARTSEVTSSEEVWVDNKNGSLIVGWLIARDILPTSVHESERVMQRYRMSVAGTPSIGAGVWTSNGKLLGVVTENDRDGFYVIPATSVPSTLEQLTQTGTIKRASLGINGLDISQLSTLVTTTKNGWPNFGFLVRGERGKVAVDLKGPSAGLVRDGDVIQHIDQETLDGRVDLGALLQSYRPMTKLALRGLRDGKVWSTTLTLGNLTASEWLLK